MDRGGRSRRLECPGRDMHGCGERPGIGAREHQQYGEMVLQIFADRQIDHRLDAHLGEMRRRTDARQHEQLRRVERAERDDHLRCGVDLDTCVALPVFDAPRARPVEPHPGDMRAGLDCEIRPLQHRA